MKVFLKHMITLFLVISVQQSVAWFWSGVEDNVKKKYGKLKKDISNSKVGRFEKKESSKIKKSKLGKAVSKVADSKGVKDIKKGTVQAAKEYVVTRPDNTYTQTSQVNF